MSKRGQRFLVIAIGVVILGLIVTLVLNAIQKQFGIFLHPNSSCTGRVAQGAGF
jgi:cytochrome c-type biogenesis protein CcmE